HLTQRDVLPRGRGQPELLRKLSPRRRLRRLVGLELTLRQRPRRRVLLRPERPAHVPEQHFDVLAPPAVEQEPGTAFTRHRTSLPKPVQDFFAGLSIREELTRRVG